MICICFRFAAERENKTSPEEEKQSEPKENTERCIRNNNQNTREKSKEAGVAASGFRM